MVLDPATPSSESGVGSDRQPEIEPRLTALLEHWVSLLVPLTGYLVVAFLLSVRYHSTFGDAQAREANGFYVFFSRDPHLAAIGFVWNPGMSIADMPMILLHNLFPALTHDTLGAGITSSFAMAGGAYHLYRFLEEQGVSPLARWAIWLMFSLNPMIISYGGNGMSEALFIFCLVASTRHLAVWFRSGAARPLVAAGFYMGLAYMVRNEAVAGAGLATMLIGGATYLREQGRPMKVRRAAALTDMVIYVLPAAVAFVGWAMVSWVIVGHPFEQYESAFGTASQISYMGLDKLGGDKFDHFTYVAHAMWTAAPLVPVLITAAAWSARRMRNPALLAVVGTLGGVCVFELAAYTTGQISWAYRYVIYVIPLAAMVAGCLASNGRGGERGHLGHHRRDVRPLLAPVLAVALLVPGVVTTGHTEFFSSIDPLDQQVMQWIVFPHLAASRRWVDFEHEWESTEKVAQQLDAMHLPRGAIMVGDEQACVPNLILQSDNPTQFFIPNDADFQGKIGSPYSNGVRYLMVPPPTGYGQADPLNVEYPGLYGDGAGIAKLVETFNISNCPSFRLYKLIPTSD